MKTSIISADAQLLNRWRCGLQGNVHSVYSHAIYLKDSNGRLFCLTTLDQLDGPEIARVSVPAFTGCAAMRMQPGDPFSASISELLCGCCTFDYADSRKWDRPLPPYPSMDTLTGSLLVAKQVLQRDGSEGGFKHFFEREAESDLVSEELQRRAGFLLAALKERRYAEVQALGCSLIGLGRGLTPSGDDFLAALMTVFQLPNSPFSEECRQIGQSWAAAADGLTTAIGAFLLRIAADGRAREPVSAFIAALTKQRTDAIVQAARQVIAFGSSSGTDWLAGLVAGLEAGVTIDRTSTLQKEQ